jgi:hypothetical protein
MIFGTNLIIPSDRPQEPQFFTLVFTDGEANQDYCHVLLTYEAVSPSILEEDSPTMLNKAYEAPQKFFPIAFCVRSKSEHIQALREILEVINNNLLNILDKHSSLHLRDFGRILACSETLRSMLWLLNEAFIPPPEVSVTCKFGSEEVCLQSDPLFGLPHLEYCFEVLFEVLDVGQVLALYKSLMLEQRVIVISRQRHLLFCICEALRMLMFPLSWMHIYVPNISEHFLGQVFGCLGIYFFGVNASFSVEDLTTQFVDATMVDIATSRLFEPLPLQFCPIAEGKLRKRLQDLKNPVYRKFDNVSLNGALCCNPTSEDDVFAMLSTSSRDMYVELARQAFLQVWLDAMQDYKQFVFMNSDNEHEFKVNDFLANFKECEEKGCTCKAYWSRVVQTNNFDNFIRQSRWLNESNATKLQTIFKPEGVEEFEVYELTIQPTLPFTQMYDDLHEVLADSPDREEALSVLKHFKTQIQLYTPDQPAKLSREKHKRKSVIMPNTLDRAFPLLKIVSPEANRTKSPQPIHLPVPVTEMNVWYGRYGLVALLKCFETLELEDIKSVSGTDVLFLEEVWQEHLIKAQMLELKRGAIEDIVVQYVKAFHLQSHCLPKYKFARHLSELIFIKEQDIRSLVEDSHGVVKRIAKAAWDDRQSERFEMRVSKVNSIDASESIRLTTSQIRRSSGF